MFVHRFLLSGACRNAALATLASLVAGCSSSYAPVRSPRVSIVFDHGNPSYVRDGQQFPGGGLIGSRLEDAVRGNPQAEEYAREFQTGMATSFGFLVGGITCFVGGVLLTDLDARPGQDKLTTPQITGLAISGVGIVSLLFSTGFLLAAAPHQFDAINAYNDGLLVHAASPVGSPSPSPGVTLNHAASVP